MTGAIQTPVVVLQVMDHGESDKIVTVFGPDVGKLVCIAKGAKRSKKRFVNKLEPFSWLEIEYVRPRRNAMARLADAELLDPFIQLRQHYDCYVAATLINELLLYWTREGDGDAQLFQLLLWAYRQLDRGSDPGLVLALFLTKFYVFMGYQPLLDGCCSCGVQGLAGVPYHFSPGRSGLSCSSCYGGAARHLDLSLGTIRLLQSAQGLAIDKLGRLKFSVRSLREALLMYRAYGQQLMQREVHSWGFVLAAN